MIMNTPQSKITAFFKILMTIMSCNTSAQLRVAENMIYAYMQLFKVTAEDSQTDVLIWALNTKIRFLIT